MMMVQVISRETIKPSSPNPHNPGNFKINAIGRNMPRQYIPLILFYNGNIDDGTKHDNQVTERTQQLKKSLSETLMMFYPLAGRVNKDNGTIECNDEGVEFSEAQVDGQLSVFLQTPSLEVLNQMVPCSISHVKSGSDVLLAIQLNHFRCGGVAIGFGMFHLVGDGSSLSNFVNQWACTARGASELIASPDLDSSALFPDNVFIPEINFPFNDNVVMKRLVFDAPNIAALRNRSAANDLKQAQPTRYEAVSALIWRCLVRAHRKEGPIASASFHAVNLRGRMVPPLPEHSFGNMALTVVAAATGNEWDGEMQSHLERKLRNAISKMDGDYIKQLQSASGVLKHLESTETEVKKYGKDCELACFYFSSWCRFPLYGADFGWGKPIWVSVCKAPLANGILLMPTRLGDGIEAWVISEKETMTKFEQDQELVPFAIFPPLLN